MMKIKTPLIVLIMAMMFGLFSCSMVKQPKSTSFQTVKYNSHLNLAKKNENKKLKPTVNSFENTAKINKQNLDLVVVDRNQEYKSLLASSESKKHAVKAAPLNIDEVESEITENKSEKAHTVFHRTKSKTNSAINDYLAKPMPVASNPPLGDILYVVLVVLLILIVLSLIADLAGGLVGALIAVLLILLILRLLGYI